MCFFSFYFIIFIFINFFFVIFIFIFIFIKKVSLKFLFLFLLFYYHNYSILFFKKKIAITQRKFRTHSENFATPYCFASEFCFAHNLFIRTPFEAFLVPLESLESVESKYIQKEHF